MIPDVKKRPIVIMLMGLPGSGKSTGRKDAMFNIEFMENGRDTVILSTDDYVENLAEETGRTYQEAFVEGTKESHKVMHEKREDAIKNRKNVIWDQTNLTVKTRAKKINQFPKEYYKVIIWYNTDITKILATNEARHATGRSLPNSVLKDMIENLEAPTKNENFDQVVEIKR